MQTLAQLLPHNECGLLKLMTRSLIALYLVIVGGIVTVGTQISVQKLEAATVTQCKHHDWPVNANDIHMAWCAANNYATN